MEFMVNKQTGERIPTAGITLYADLPVGSWVKNDMTPMPTGFLKEGDTISQSQYPELYAKYGSTVPYMADTSELSEYETASTSFTAQYDGFINANSTGGTGYGIAIRINGTLIANNSNATYGVNGISAVLKKGDTVSITGEALSSATIKVAYYKKSLIVKAKNTGAPTDIIEGVRDALCSYSTTETVVGTWVDGKPIYRKVYPVTITEPVSVTEIIITLDTTINKNNAKLISFGGYLEPGTSSDNYMKGIPYIFRTTGGDYASIACAIGSSGIEMIYTYINPGNTGYIWVEYTKTTD